MSAKTTSVKKSMPFNEAIEELELLVKDLEHGDQGLEVSLQSFERGVSLARHCRKALNDAEQKVRVLTETEQGFELQDLND